MTVLPRRGRAAGEAGRLAALLLSPTFVVLGLVVGYPLVAALRESLYQTGQTVDAEGFVVQGERFVGLDNYAAMFSGPAAARFWNAFGNTTFFTVVTVAAEVVIGVAMALVMHQALRWRGIVRAGILVPWAIPTAVSAILWQWIFQADGVANAIIGSQVLWTTEGWQAKAAVMIADIWKTAPFIGLLVLAGLQIIPRDVYEAARVDGAGPVRQFFSITLPLVRPVLVVAVLFRVLDTLRMFDLPFVLIGNRKESVETLTMLAWDEASNLRFGPAAAYATVLFGYVAVVALVFVKLLGADVIGEARERIRKDRARKEEPLVRPGVVHA
ncbi:carbohydrate ABC transporter permease [Kibdelosporangium persicum]|uniref:Binding-protein-dependent transport systems inner membrane component n=1 Tax=Kibdelosporangium persicum TaxID=2698649 RepID=A0ABX2F1Y6_9PSEU|nr:sugar ABC transporter permease [Kibdelosporangium persicum]NRN65242.1 Binding-protein-dependent transport systems inner membrane component [Kibdelosporangium persicum]